MFNHSKKLKHSFDKVKDDFLSLEHQISSFETILKRQNDIILLLTEKITKSQDFPQETKVPEKSSKSQEFSSSSGNNGVNQSINQSITHSLSTENTPIQSNFEELDYYSSQGIKHLSTPNQSLKHINQSKSAIYLFKSGINQIFSKLSKQELRIFLTIYDLEDQKIEVSYTNIALKMNLTEACIRGYISSLIKKESPIYRTRPLNKQTIIGVNKDFRELNLKQSLINLYYETDPHQRTLFDM